MFRVVHRSFNQYSSLLVGSQRQLLFYNQRFLGTQGFDPIELSFYQTKTSDDNKESVPLLAFHGLFGNKNNLRSLINQIAAMTRRQSYSFDLRNHGESPHVPFDRFTIELMATDILNFMDRNGFKKAILMGHSLGGRVVAQFAFNWPEMIEKLILVDIGPLSSLPRIEFLTENFFHLLDSCLKDLPPNINLSDARIQVKKILNEKIKNTLIADFLVLNLYQNQNERSICWRFNLDAIEKFIAKGSIKNMDIKKPFSGQSMIIYGENSPYVRPEQFDQIRAVMPSVKFVGIPETGHYLHVEKPVQFIQKVIDFIGST